MLNIEAMMTAPPMTATQLPPRQWDPLAALLSYLLPGLGQVLQGRIGKGVLFFVCLCGLFFYGLWMGRMKNVWVPEPSKLPDVSLPLVGKLPGITKAVYHRPQFLGQFWMGVAVWPALAQYVATEAPVENAEVPAAGLPVLKDYMAAPNEKQLNDLQRGEDKTWDLGWVYTVIAGVLNMLVIYDALAGPMVRQEDEADGKTDPNSGATGAGS
jgi:hypothetical protein